MTCLNCIHVINRTMGPEGEEYHYCEVDGFPIITPIASCNRFESVFVPAESYKDKALNQEYVGSVENAGGCKCDVCGKVLKTKLALIGHKRSHK